MATDPLIDDVAGAVLDGDPVDWADVEARTDASATALLKQMQVLSVVAGMHCEKQSDASRAGARAEAEQSWGPLRLLERIGRGAFGEVYRSWDPRLDREVALKLLPAPVAGDGAAPSIIEEGRLLARVRHPGVVTIHGAEQIGDRIGLWMEYVRGRTLAELLEDGESFTPEDVIRIGLELCGAVAAVHAAGVIHRDIKAHNVVRTEEGRVVLMDFGTGLDATRAASAPAGTPLYLAPELFAGGPATVRSDIYSLGVLLYHLLTGTYPVTGKSLHDVRMAHERGERTALTDVRPDLPRRLIRAIEHAIDPQPERRCHSAAAFAVALQSAQPSSRRRWIVGLAAAAAIFMLWMGQTGRVDTGENRSLAAIARAPAESFWSRLWPTRRLAIVVLPFKSLGTIADSDLMADGLTFEVASILTRVEGLEVRSAASSFALGGKPRDLAAVGTELEVDFVVEGELLAWEDRVRVIARLVSVREDVPSWDQPFERRGKDVMGVQQDIALAIVNHLRLELGGLQQRHEIEPVLQMKFLRARRLAATHDLDLAVPQAVSLFEEILAEEPSYAPAWAGLASALGSIVRLRPDAVPASLPRMKQAAEAAYERDPLLAEAIAAIGVVHAHALEWAESRKSFAEALSRNRNLATIHTDAALQLLLPLGQLDEAMELLEVARDIDPGSLDVHRTLAAIQVEAGKYEEAIRNAGLVLERDPTYPFAANRLGRALALSGRPDEALRIFEEDHSVGPAYVGYMYAMTGRRDEAEAVARNAANNPGERATATQFWIYGGLGDKERAFEALNRLVEKNPWRAATWMRRPEVAFLRDDPRFDEIRRRLRIPR
jgi:serine/threonine-protein kinase